MASTSFASTSDFSTRWWNHRELTLLARPVDRVHARHLSSEAPLFRRRTNERTLRSSLVIPPCTFHLVLLLSVVPFVFRIRLAQDTIENNNWSSFLGWKICYTIQAFKIAGFDKQIKALTFRKSVKNTIQKEEKTNWITIPKLLVPGF